MSEMGAPSETVAYIAKLEARVDALETLLADALRSAVAEKLRLEAHMRFGDRRSEPAVCATARAFSLPQLIAGPVAFDLEGEE